MAALTMHFITVGKRNEAEALLYIRNIWTITGTGE